MLGNHKKQGCLTTDENVRLHSCERGQPCAVLGVDKSNHQSVHIVPLVTRTKEGREIIEAGVGGGRGDLDQAQEIDLSDLSTLKQFVGLCIELLKTRDDSELHSNLIALLSAARDRQRAIRIEEIMQSHQKLDQMPLPDLVELLANLANQPDDDQSWLPSDIFKAQALKTTLENGLPKVISFPYSRHSSFVELCDIIAMFKPRDIYPCTVDFDTWTPEMSMRTLFGHLCSADLFEFDYRMAKEKGIPFGGHDNDQHHEEHDDDGHSTQRTTMTEESNNDSQGQAFAERVDVSEQEATSPSIQRHPSLSQAQVIPGGSQHPQPTTHDALHDTPALASSTFLPASDNLSLIRNQEWVSGQHDIEPQRRLNPRVSSPLSQDKPKGSAPFLQGLPKPTTPEAPLSTAELAYHAALGYCGFDWCDFGGLVSAGNNHTEKENEL